MEVIDRKFSFDSKIEEQGVVIVRALRLAGFEAFFVGGYVRDKLLGGKPKDVDIVTSAKPDEVIALFERTIPVGAAFGVITVVIGGEAFEVATFRAEADYKDGRRPETVVYADAEADALRRDFTINALFYDPIDGKIFDFTSGLSDMEKRVVRAIGVAEERFTEDYLRMLRAVRFSARLGFEIEAETLTAVTRNSRRINGISKERIFAEMNSMLVGENSDRAFQLLFDTGLLKEIIPELIKQDGCPQPPIHHPEGDVWTHTKLLLKRLKPDSPASVGWAALLHDIGKPATLTFKADGTPTMPLHASVGAKMAEELLLELRSPKKLSDDVSKMVYNHMTFANVQQMRPATLRRFISNDTFLNEMELHWLDCMASSGRLDNYNFLLEKVKELEEEGEPLQLPPPLVNGKDVIQLGLKPGPQIGKLLTQATDLQLSNDLKTREEALQWLKAAVEKVG